MKPKLATAKEINKFIKIIDKNRYYSNYGPLYHLVAKQIKKKFNLKKKNIVLSSSCFSSLLATLLLIKLKTKRRVVLVQSFGFFADIQSIILAGFQPYFIDINPEKNHADDDSIKNFIKTKSKIKISDVACCIIISPFGKPVKVEEINNIVKKYKIEVIYDAANTFLNLSEEIDNANFNILCSFHPTKSLAANESGCIVCNKKDKKELESILNFGIKQINLKRDIISLGFNGKFSEYDAAIFLANFKNFEKKKIIYTKFRQIILKEKKINKKLKINFDNNFWISNILTVHFENEKIKKYYFKRLRANRIHFYYPWGNKLLSDYSIFKEISKTNLKNSRHIVKNLIAIFLQPDYSIKKIKKIISILK
jgi:dTDP-4-amino-4,6-dideoxygalactose transaminase